MASASPRVSCLMSAFNAAQYIQEALDSVLRQKYKDFEIIVIDDGSTDATWKVLSSFHDSRLIRIRNPKNLGLVASLRIGLDIARGSYVAKLDADDIALPELLELQVRCLDSDPTVGIVGTSLIDIDEEGHAIRTVRYPADDVHIQWDLLFGSPITHSGVMYRKDLLLRHTSNYRTDFVHCEDYDLWSQLLNHCRAANIAEPLVKRRLHNNSVSHIFNSIQLENLVRISHRTISERFPTVMIEERDVRGLLLLISKKFRGVNRDIAMDPTCTLRVAQIYFNMLCIFARRYQSESSIYSFVANQVRWFGSAAYRLHNEVGFRARFIMLLFRPVAKLAWMFPLLIRKRFFTWPARSAETFSR